jgi:8-oxo-dGTP pyrophosphatase MutT (NUDIX family)
MHEQFIRFINELQDKLKMPLPGLSSQMKMATLKRAMHDGKVDIPADARQAGVIVLFYRKGEDIFIPFIKRNEYPGVHSGQISFPGGGREEHDRDIIQTALRETEEEIGVARRLVKPIGHLSELFIPPSNFVVTPVVSFIEEIPEFYPNPSEVDRVLEVPLKELLHPRAIQLKEITIFPEVKVQVPCYFIDGQVIWGATAMMLSELLEVIVATR